MYNKPIVFLIYITVVGCALDYGQTMHTEVFTYSEQSVKALQNKASFISLAIGIVEKFLFKIHNRGNDFFIFLFISYYFLLHQDIPASDVNVQQVCLGCQKPLKLNFSVFVVIFNYTLLHCTSR